MEDFKMSPAEYQKWCSIADKVMKNKKGMGLEVSLKIVGGKLKLAHKVKGQYEKNWPAMQTLIVVLCQGAIKLIYNELFPAYATEKDEAQEYERCQSIINENVEYYLTVLINEGKEKFLEKITSQAVICKVQYMMNHMTCKEGIWSLPNGDTWNGSGWQNADGNVYYDVMSDICQNILVS